MFSRDLGCGLRRERICGDALLDVEKAEIGRGVPEGNIGIGSGEPAEATSSSPKSSE